MASLLFCLALCAPPATAQTPAELARFTAEKSLGNPSAPIKLEVFDDYECPACDQLYEGTLRPMIDSYVAEGKVYLIHRDFPLPGHLYSRQAARWVNAAARIGKFEAVERALFDNQMAWSEYGTENPKGIIKPFVKAALTPVEFERVERLMKGCEINTQDEIKGCALDEAIQHDIALGQLLPITVTPTFVVTYGGEKYPPGTGAISWPLMRQFFDQLLSQK
ncbi:MAG: thioredoxin domain-containing protein [Candidatus Acidiferrales bacterium]